VVEQFASGIATLRGHLPELLQPAERTELETIEALCNGAGLPTDLGQWVAGLEVLYSGLDLVEVANQVGLPVPAVAAVYFELAGRLELSWLRRRIGELATAGHWQNRARAALLNGLYEQGRTLTLVVLQSALDVEPERRLALWLEHHRAGVERCRALFAELKAAGRPDLAMLSVALRETADLGAGGTW
jgi:glutamate dehydrogenase